jgi:hypothetical protein
MPTDNRKPRVPKAAREWDADGVLSIGSVITRYERGCSAALYQPEEREALCAALPTPDGEQVAYDNGLVGAADGTLTLLYLPAQRQWNVWPKPAQETGDCTSRAGANIATVLIGMEVDSGLPDEQTGRVEGWPELSAEGIRQGVVSCETIYGDRGRSGQGASCDRLIRHMVQDSGVILRRDYTAEGGPDLTKLNTKLGMSWGRSGTPDKVRALGRENPIRTATDAPNWKVALDFVASGYPLWSCSGLGWSDTRDDWGYSVQRGSWSHSWIIAGQDSRPETVRKYGFPLALYGHDWGRWNRGPRKVYGTEHEIPEGFMWIDARLLDKCDVTAMSSLSGFPRRQLPDYLGGWK